MKMLVQAQQKMLPQILQQQKQETSILHSVKVKFLPDKYRKNNLSFVTKKIPRCDIFIHRSSLFS